MEAARAGFVSLVVIGASFFVIRSWFFVLCYRSIPFLQRERGGEL